MLVSGINGGYGVMPQLEQETLIWDALVERYRAEHPEPAAELDRRLAEVDD